MKNKFDMFNDIEIDFSQYEEIPFNESEKKKLLNSLNKNIKPKRNINKRLIASIALVTILCGFTFTNETVLANIDYISKKTLSSYISSAPKGSVDEYTNVIGKTIYDKGIAVTLNEVFIDKNQIIVSYSVDFRNYKKDKRNYDLYDYTVSPRYSTTINGHSVGSGWIDYSDKPNDVFDEIYSYSLHDLDLDTTDSHINISIDFDQITFIEYKKGTFEENARKRIKGDWKFNFTVDKNTIIKSTKTIVPSNQNLIVNNNTFRIDKVDLSPISLKIFYYSSDPSKVPNIKVYDEFNNELFLKLSSSGTKNYESFEFRLSEKSNKFTIVPQDDDTSLSNKNTISLSFN